MPGRRMLVGAGCIAILLAALALGGCGGGDSTSADSGTKTFESAAFPFTFEYPELFDLKANVSLNQSVGGGSTEDNTALELNAFNAIIIQKKSLDATVDADNLDAAKREFDQLLADVDPKASGQTGETGGFPSISYTAFPLQSVPNGQVGLTLLFDGDTEYVIECQFTPQQQEAMNSACDQALATLERS